jgi:hypothetical protein
VSTHLESRFAISICYHWKEKYKTENIANREMGNREMEKREMQNPSQGILDRT